MTFTPTAARTRQVLAFLADHGDVTEANGRATAVVARGVGISVTYAGNILGALDAADCIIRELGHRKTFGITLTDRGRRALRIDRAVSKRQAERRRTVVRPGPVAPPPMPVCGPIARMPFDIEATREAAMEGAFG